MQLQFDSPNPKNVFRLNDIGVRTRIDRVLGIKG